MTVTGWICNLNKECYWHQVKGILFMEVTELLHDSQQVKLFRDQMVEFKVIHHLVSYLVL